MRTLDTENSNAPAPAVPSPYAYTSDDADREHKFVTYSPSTQRVRESVSPAPPKPPQPTEAGRLPIKDKRWLSKEDFASSSLLFAPVPKHQLYFQHSPHPAQRGRRFAFLLYLNLRIVDGTVCEHPGDRNCEHTRHAMFHPDCAFSGCFCWWCWCWVLCEGVRYGQRERELECVWACLWVGNGLRLGDGFCRYPGVHMHMAMAKR